MAAASAHAPSLSRRVFAALLVATAVAVAIAFAASALLFQASAEQDVRSSLDRECDLVASALDASPDDDDAAVAAGLDLGDMRVTLVGPDGSVLYDNEGDPSGMESHADRPEVREALANGEGTSERLSETLDVVSFYHARRLESGAVVRVAQDSRTAFSVITGDLAALAVVAALVIALSWVAARVLARVLVSPILAMDPLGGTRADAAAASPYRELEPLVDRLNDQQATLVEQMDQLRDAEVMRQEFTANVTHELKTPLAAISGAAELIRDGIARPEDVPNFAGRIYDESQRLTSLVNDILTLSNLDEAERSSSGEAASVLGSTEPVDLPQMLESVQQRLDHMAHKADVALFLDVHPAMVVGVPRLLDELAYNLVSNAIRYNRPGGSVVVACGLGDEGRPFIRVEDTGIGIAEAEQAKVFERFYRVDKSRSKARGGTGLGLAIVKHAAAFHGATINLESQLDCGTRITVTFPVQVFSLE